MGEYVKKKKDMIFQSGDSLQQVVNVVNEAAVALNDPLNLCASVGLLFNRVEYSQS